MVDPSTPFRALVVRRNEDRTYTRAVERRTVADLPEGDVLIRVAYSSLNYKDALSATGHPGVTREFPHTPGIDAAGTVAESSSEAFRPGEEVVVLGHDLGMETDGGYGEYVRVPADWIVHRPDGLTLRETMIVGTAGFTAAMSVRALLDHGVTPTLGEALVTGATGGVGTFAVGILARCGFEVVAVTGKPEAREFLTGLGATEIVDRDALVDTSRPLLPARWSAVVDCVGGDLLASAIAGVKPFGGVAITGLVGSPELHTSVYPFILRGIALLGIDSQVCNVGTRPGLWKSLANEWKLDGLDGLAREVALDDLDPEIDRILEGKQRGRVVVRI